jgi:hypothetical protein
MGKTTELLEGNLTVIRDSAGVPIKTVDERGRVVAYSGLVVPKTSGYGIKVDDVTPTFGWRDIIGSVQPKASGAGSPTRAVYDGGNVGAYSFIANDVCDFGYHIPHDWAPTTDLLWHTHWSHTGTSISGSLVIEFYYQIAKRDGVFGAEKTLTLTYPTVDLATTPRRKKIVTETPMTAAVATATVAATSEVEVDGFVEGTLKIITLPTIGGGGKLFIHTSDIHYQSTNIGTKNNAADFYS